MASSGDSEARRIGGNVRRARQARGLSLEVVAGLAGRSAAWLSLIERGLRPLERRSDIAALAAALRVSPTDLLMVDVPYGIGGEPEGVQQLRDLLLETTIDDPPDVEPRPLTVLAELVSGPIAAYDRSADNASLARTIPPVLAELHVHAASGKEIEHRQALRLIVDASTSAAFMLRYLGAIELAWIAADRARQAAIILEDPVYEGSAWFVRAHARPTAWQAGPLRRAAAAAERIEPYLGKDVRAHQVYGLLHLSAALSAQVAGSEDRVQEHLSEAERVAHLTGERADAWRNFGPANVATWRTMLDVEGGRPSQALATVSTIAREPLWNNRRAAVEIEVARAYAMLGRGHQNEVIQHLGEAERIAADSVHHHPLVRELVADMLDHAHRTAVGRELRGLAHRMKIAS